MAYSAEVVQRARARLAQAKEDRESENRQHLAEAYTRVPRIKEIDMQLRRTMAQAAQAAFLQGSDGRELMEQIRGENLALQRERACIQSTSDQENYRLYAMITANAPAALTPEQAAVWSYPLADSDRETTIFNMVNALPLRIHQSGHLGELSEETYSLVEEALDYYKTIRQDIKCAVPFWPLGLADVTDTWLSLGLRNGIRNYLAVWRNGDERDICTMKISHLKGRELTIRCAYPSTEDCRYSWNKESGEFTVVLKEAVSARFFEITEKI